MDVIHSPKCLEYELQGHPESPQRIRLAADYLRRQGYTFIEPVACSEEDLLRVHTREHVDRIRRGSAFELDTPSRPEMYAFACLAVGAAITAAERQAFSLMRPPGHHAGRDFNGGFSYFNNIASAVAKLGRRTLIVDFDGHHGNGTQDIFRDDPKVHYLSLHGRGFPGTGLTSGSRYSNNALFGQVGDSVFLKSLEALLAHTPQTEQLAVSAGFDAYVDDPLASLGLSQDCYHQVGRLLAGLRLPTFCVLEGGYVPEALGPSIHSFLLGLNDTA